MSWYVNNEQKNVEVTAGGSDPWRCLIDDRFVTVAIMQQDPSKMLPGFAPQWRVSVYDAKVHGIEKFFENEQDARATYEALTVAPSMGTLVDVWGFEWN
jgi:O-phosphoseryl-tRNA(Cys) synthetase